MKRVRLKYLRIKKEIFFCSKDKIIKCYVFDIILCNNVVEEKIVEDFVFLRFFLE